MIWRGIVPAQIDVCSVPVGISLALNFGVLSRKNNLGTGE
jgi:hypothetical protein